MGRRCVSEELLFNSVGFIHSQNYLKDCLFSFLGSRSLGELPGKYYMEDIL